jgi:hypothetical protein
MLKSVMVFEGYNFLAWFVEIKILYVIVFVN